MKGGAQSMRRRRPISDEMERNNVACGEEESSPPAAFSFGRRSTSLVKWDGKDKGLGREGRCDVRARERIAVMSQEH